MIEVRNWAGEAGRSDGSKGEGGRLSCARRRGPVDFFGWTTAVVVVVVVVARRSRRERFIKETLNPGFRARTIVE